MSAPAQNFSKLSFFKTYVIPALLLFIIPVFALWFFKHVQADYDHRVKESILKDIKADTEATAEQRAKALAFFERTPMSAILVSDDPGLENLRKSISTDARFHYATFHWMILLSWFCILSGVGVFIVAGISVAYSLRSQVAQYYSLSIGWYVLRIFSTLQVLAQGGLAVALSFWVTAFWMEAYYVKLIAVAGLLAIGAAVVVIAAIFKRIDDRFVLEGVVIERGAESPLWAEMDRICAAVGTQPPDRIIAGIDNNFFVTEHAVTLNDKVYEGRTLYVSLSLLKVLDGTEADAVMAHEMAHFSGNDTLYSKRISPLLNRFGIYLQALHGGVLSLPVFYFMLCFRGLFEVSLGKLSREREFRADNIAAQVTSPRDIAHSLVKIAAYSEYRGKVEQSLFDAEQVHENLNISQRVAAGFKEFASSFVKDGRINEAQTAHPFDTHPPTAQRMAAVNVRLEQEDILSLLQKEADGRWYRNIGTAGELEQQQWTAYEDRFRQFHERMLAYRYVPETDAEREIVLKYFPGVTFEGKKKGSLVIDHEKVCYSEWEDALPYTEITLCTSEQSTMGHPHIRIDFKREKAATRTFPLDAFQVDQQSVFNAFDEFYSRHVAMTHYRKEKLAQADPDAGGSAAHEG